MKSLFAGALTATVITWSATIAQSIPFGGDQTQDSLVVSVADKCGIGRYRDANGVCRRKYHFGKGPKQYYGSCGGANAHRVCNFTGQCWMVCD